ncbi:bifunctional riboflavin kinase/FMN adenylyltransferase RibF [Thermoclostridium stercorarium subsp. stercorarium DSM 8532]|uniref:Riboflavin biosynthesis protein n=1 Tax=Thermoclostridium stercorarium (strain ATCC 35414 / DSM 8532 / NCIMB 11754) TaxID=1121335 RepID=L7VN41_THES1|nr:bifunctional riboflavin kinase/FMN adenylyltransferase RibF [Thermoclostridium stercorarium subsp. stercorarium DSM 8532]
MFVIKRKGQLVEVFENEFSITDSKYCGVGLGNFDGLHRGHMALINTLLDECRISDLHSVVYTFKKHPEHILRKELLTPLIMTTEHKVRLLEKTGLEFLVFQEFDEEFSRISPREFVEEILVNKLKARLVVVGFNYRFGYMGKGDCELLKELGQEYGFKVIVIPPVKIGNEVVSSTAIRKYVIEGQMEKANEFLGRFFSISGKVVTGKGIGNTMGFPTANIDPEKFLVTPAEGVYVTRTLYQGKWYDSVTNVGKCPTVRSDGATTIETHMIDFTGELYGEDIEVSFIKRLRGEKLFKNREELINQIRTDIENAKMYKKHLCLG